MPPPTICFVTGRLAADALRAVVVPLGAEAGFVPHVTAMKISVAALMNPDWLVGKLEVPPGTAKVLLPGGCTGDPARLAAALGVPVEKGPFDLRDLPQHFQRPAAAANYGPRALEILAEINHANRLTLAALLALAQRYAGDGADIVDLGATPGEPWADVADAVRLLRDAGLRVSIDSFEPHEVAAATKAGAELVLSVNAGNRAAAADWGAEVVVVPDFHADAGPEGWLTSLAETAEFLDRAGVAHRLDPILEPLGFGFAASLGRYLEVRRRFPATPALMGVGNVTELTEADTAGMNALLAGFCAEAGIGSVLTTEVAPWARGCVRELDLAGRLMHFAATERRLPKHVDPRLVALRAGKFAERTPDELRALHAALKDPNFRLFADGGTLTATNAGLFEQHADAFALFRTLGVTDASHAFYLGWELMKATLALQLGKRYTQDQALDFGYLTRQETAHRERGEASGQA